MCEMKEALGISQPTVSEHLKVLDEAGLTVSRKKGLWMYYRLSNGQNSPYAIIILGSFRHWLEQDTEVKAALANVKSGSDRKGAERYKCQAKM